MTPASFSALAISSVVAPYSTVTSISVALLRSSGLFNVDKSTLDPIISANIIASITIAFLIAFFITALC